MPRHKYKRTAEMSREELEREVHDLRDMRWRLEDERDAYRVKAEDLQRDVDETVLLARIFGTDSDSVFERHLGAKSAVVEAINAVAARLGSVGVVL